VTIGACGWDGMGGDGDTDLVGNIGVLSK